MARVAQRHRPKLAHAKGAKVTVPSLQLHGVVRGYHVSYRVLRVRPNDGTLAEVVVGEDEDVEHLLDGEPLDTHVSYLVYRHWDDTEVWVEESQLQAGHAFESVKALMPHPSSTPAGARQ